MDLLSVANRQEFLESGYLHLRGFIEPRQCESLILRMRELTERKCHDDRSHIFEAGADVHTKDEFFLASANRIHFFFDKNVHTKKGPSNFRALNKVGHALHRLCPVFAKFSHQDKFYHLMSLLGQRKPDLIQSMFIFKQAHGGDEVPAHQDASFLYTQPNSVIGLWFALEDADVDNGCLWALEGGHKGKLKNRFLRSKKGLIFDYQQKVDWPKEAFRPLPAKACDVIVLHGLLPHFSYENRSSKTRYAYTTHFVDGKAYYPKTNWLQCW